MGADRDDQGTHHAADQGIGEPPLNAGSGIGACQAAEAQRYAGRPVRGHSPVVMKLTRK